MLNSGGGVQCVRRVVVGINQRWSNRPVRNAAGIDRLKRGDPAALREVVVIHAHAGAKNCLLRGAQCLRDAETRRKRLAVVMRNAVDESGAERGIETLIVAGGNEQAEGRVVAQARNLW